jgi:hypothetical protein
VTVDTGIDHMRCFARSAHGRPACAARVSKPVEDHAAKSGDCTGTNGNTAVAACHPDDPAVQTAYPDNSNGEKYAAPTDECLEAVRASSDKPTAARPAAGPGHPLRADSSCADWAAADRASKQAFLTEAIGTVNINLLIRPSTPKTRTSALTG